MLQILKKFLWYKGSLGSLLSAKVLFAIYCGGDTIKIKIPHMANHLFLRKNTSDQLVFEQIFINKEYELNLNFNPKFIIDGGANVGYSAIYFANKYPQAKIIAVEPEESNYKMLKMNTSCYPKIKALQSAIWINNSSLEVKDPGSGKWGYITKPAQKGSEGSITACSISGLLKKFNLSRIDILKLDVEGAEKEIFSKNYNEWLELTRVITMELHDPINPGCTLALNRATKNQKFKKFINGEKVVLIRKM